MNRSIATALVLAALALPARADNEPLLWPDGTITYRDWGLYRPGVPVLIERPYYGGYYDGRPVTKNEGVVVPYLPSTSTDQYLYPADNPDYFPTNRRDPSAYRMRPRIRPVAPEPYFRQWGVGSDPNPAPASEPAAQVEMPVDPNVIYAPDDHHRRKPPHHP